jgi:hypothetical protein
VEEYESNLGDKNQYDDSLSNLSTFRCSGFFEMKINEVIGPYKYIDCSGYKNNSNCFIFELVHMDIIVFINKIKQLRDEMAAEIRGASLNKLTMNTRLLFQFFLNITDVFIYIHVYIYKDIYIYI